MTEAMSVSRSLRARLYWWLERPDRSATGPWLVEIALVVLISLNVAAVILETVTPIYARWQVVLSIFEFTSLTLFVAEYCGAAMGCSRKSSLQVPAGVDQVSARGY